MSPEAKNTTSLIAAGIGLMLEIIGVLQALGSFGDKSIAIKGAVYIIMGLVIGLPAIIYHYYYRGGQAKWFPSQTEVDARTLSALANDKKSAQSIRPTPKPPEEK